MYAGGNHVDDSPWSLINATALPPSTSRRIDAGSENGNSDEVDGNLSADENRAFSDTIGACEVDACAFGVCEVGVCKVSAREVNGCEVGACEVGVWGVGV